MSSEKFLLTWLILSWLVDICLTRGGRPGGLCAFFKKGFRGKIARFRLNINKSIQTQGKLIKPCISVPKITCLDNVTLIYGTLSKWSANGLRIIKENLSNSEMCIKYFSQKNGQI
ncbi:hypothetical protein BpHYR1_000032 [Brachionus plicatilis]|uniref:Uncharacterized protein n=1 Tax=Brachionus plicatilis TaxID=10195 RepID=A0A3M7QKM2_BRAPC|nr:hypothetical protein BpHYR1_000032 [Brachionus plicatilis]